MVGNSNHGGADSGEAVFLCIGSARRELPLLSRSGFSLGIGLHLLTAAARA
jgi:hypothetical protein